MPKSVTSFAFASAACSMFDAYIYGVYAIGALAIGPRCSKNSKRARKSDITLLETTDKLQQSIVPTMQFQSSLKTSRRIPTVNGTSPYHA